MSCGRPQQLLDRAVALFKLQFHELASCQLYYGKAGGRIEVVGNHTDYNEGFILSAAIDKYTVFVGAVLPEKDGPQTITIYSEQTDYRASFPVHDTVKYSAEHPASWVNYPKGVIVHLLPPPAPGAAAELSGGTGPTCPPSPPASQQQQGFCGVYVSEVPVGAGVSSSTALDIAMAMFLRAAFPSSLAGEWRRHCRRGALL